MIRELEYEAKLCTSVESLRNLYSKTLRIVSEIKLDEKSLQQMQKLASRPSSKWENRLATTSVSHFMDQKSVVASSVVCRRWQEYKKNSWYYNLIISTGNQAETMLLKLLFDGRVSSLHFKSNNKESEYEIPPDFLNATKNSRKNIRGLQSLIIEFDKFNGLLEKFINQNLSFPDCRHFTFAINDDDDDWLMDEVVPNVQDVRIINKCRYANNLYVDSLSMKYLSIFTDSDENFNYILPLKNNLENIFVDIDSLNYVHKNRELGHLKILDRVQDVLNLVKQFQQSNLLTTIRTFPCIADIFSKMMENKSINISFERNYAVDIDDEDGEFNLCNILKREPNKKNNFEKCKCQDENGKSKYHESISKAIMKLEFY
jgi:hypothetical protein